MAAERLQKILARAGVASRRKAEQLILEGRVRVDGRVVRRLGTEADPRRQRIEVDGRRVVLEAPVHYLLHKPRGVVSTLHDPQGRPTVADLVRSVGRRVFPVGRLDYHTAGALLVTDDGELCDALLRPSGRVPKVYAVKMRGHLDEEELGALRKGVVLDDGRRTRPAEVFVLREEPGYTWLQMTLTEGRNRQIHRMGQAIGRPVLKLTRISFAGISIDGMRPGEMRRLRQKEIDKLVKHYVLPYRARMRARQRSAEEESGLDNRRRRAK